MKNSIVMLSCFYEAERIKESTVLIMKNKACGADGSNPRRRGFNNIHIHPYAVLRMYMPSMYVHMTIGSAVCSNLKTFADLHTCPGRTVGRCAVCHMHDARLFDNRQPAMQAAAVVDGQLFISAPDDSTFRTPTSTAIRLHNSHYNTSSYYYYIACRLSRLTTDTRESVPLCFPHECNFN